MPYSLAAKLSVVIDGEDSPIQCKKYKEMRAEERILQSKP